MKLDSNILLINKPKGLTSHDVVAKIRWGIKSGEIFERSVFLQKILALAQKDRPFEGIRVGHTGTLDPAATGLLIILIGREATKKQSEFLKLDKEYVGEIELGKTTDTLDSEGKIIKIDKNILKISQNDIKKALTELLGEQIQEVPAYSAVKVKGKKLYDLARKGKEIEELPKRKIIFYELELISLKKSLENKLVAKIRVHCSSGTYVRSFARDLALKLGTIGYLKSLERTKIGNYCIEDSIELSEII